MLISRSERRDRIRRELDGAARKLGGHVLIKGQPQAEALLDEVPDLIEYPSVVAGAFGADFLQLPEEVLATTLIHHQHYFPVAGPQGKLLPAFLAVTNTQPGNERGIAVNAERVVSARLRDARFFWDTDRTVGLEARLARLDTVLFHKALGSYGAKAKRIEALARWIATDVFKQDATVADQAARAAKLCKADLATDMVGEFPELQGVMGGVYAREAGEPEAVWKAMYHHYAPIGVEADAPPTLDALGAGKVTWACVSLADKIDTLVGLFKAGEKPTGSRDPFGMRRAAQGVMKILADASALGLPACDVRDIFNKALTQFGFIADEGTPSGFVDTFMKERVVHLLERRGVSAEASRAVSEGWYEPAKCVQKAEALDAELKNPKSELRALAEIYKRIANITKGVTTSTLDASVLKEPAEIALNSAFNSASAAASAAWQSGGGFSAAIREYVKLRPSVDQFFADVMVMVDDATLRDARLALLVRLRDAITQNIGDLAQLGATAETK